MSTRAFYERVETKNGWVIRNAETGRVVYDKGTDGKPLDGMGATKLAAVLNQARSRR